MSSSSVTHYEWCIIPGNSCALSRPKKTSVVFNEKSKAKKRAFNPHKASHNTSRKKLLYMGRFDCNFLIKKKCPTSGQISPSKGLVSIDRSVIAALLGTTPRPRRKSSTIDFVPSRLMCCIAYVDLRCLYHSKGSGHLQWLSHLGRWNQSSRVYSCLPT